MFQAEEGRTMTLAARAHRVPMLFFLAISAFMLVLLAACTPESKAEMTTYNGINAIRAENGLPPLTPDAGLLTVARIRSRDMATLHYFSHNPPDGCNYACLLDANSVPYSWAGENIAWNTYDWSQTGANAVQMWKNSPPHMQNILNCHFERFATGVSKGSDGKVYYTMIFEGAKEC
jgi:uncharacterized protein YkwD